jgi:hypothetical protein
MTTKCSANDVTGFFPRLRALLHGAIIFNIHSFRIVGSAKNVNLFFKKIIIIKENFKDEGAAKARNRHENAEV